MAPTMTKAELRTAQRIREIDRPPTSVNLSISVSGQKSRKDLQILEADRCNYSFIHSLSVTAYPLQVHREAGAWPSCHWTRGGVHFGQVGSSSQG